MKKHSIIFITAVVVLSLSAYGIMSSKSPETETDLISEQVESKAKLGFDVIRNEMILPNFFLDVGTRYNSIAKTQLDKAVGFSDFIGEAHANRIVSYQKLSVVLLDDDESKKFRLDGTSGTFTDDQLALLKTLQPSTNLIIWADYLEKNKQTGSVEASHWTPYLTITPEQQTVYEQGKDVLIKHFREGLKDALITVDENKLQSGMLIFTISKEGKVTSLRLQNSSGYPEIDKKVQEQILNLPGKFLPAINAKGEAIEQELALSFGRGGC